MVVCTSNTPKLYSKQLVAYTSKHRKHHNTPNIVKNTNNVYTRPDTSKTAFPTVTKELLGAKFEFRNSKMLVCASNAPKLYSKQLVSYTSKHRKHHNTPNTAKNTITPYIRPERSKPAFPTVTKEPLGATFEFRNSKMVVWASNAPKLYSKQLVAYTSKHTAPQTGWVYSRRGWVYSPCEWVYSLIGRVSRIWLGL